MGEEDNGLSLEGLAHRLQALERENAELRQEVSALRSSGTRRGEVPALRDSGMHRTKEPALALIHQSALTWCSRKFGV
jgi:hypothetical protein